MDKASRSFFCERTSHGIRSTRECALSFHGRLLVKYWTKKYKLLPWTGMWSDFSKIIFGKSEGEYQFFYCILFSTNNWKQYKHIFFQTSFTTNEEKFWFFKLFPNFFPNFPNSDFSKNQIPKKLDFLLKFKWKKRKSKRKKVRWAQLLQRT